MILAAVAKSTAGAPARFAWLAVAGLAAVVAMAALSALAGSGVRHRPQRGYDAQGFTAAVAARMSPSAAPMPAPRNGRRPGVTPEYRDYIMGRIPGKDTIYWPERIKPWKAELRARRGRCEIGVVLARGGYPNCGPAPVTGPIHADHKTYANLFRETRADVALGCAPCHVERERLKRAGTDIYAAWGEQ